MLINVWVTTSLGLGRRAIVLDGRLNSLKFLIDYLILDDSLKIFNNSRLIFIVHNE